MGEKYASSFPTGRPPPRKDFLRKRLYLFSNRSRENPFAWGCGPVGFGIITVFGRYIENKVLLRHRYQWEGSFRCIKTHIYNIGITALIPPQHKCRLFHPLSPEYQLDHQSFTQHFFQDFYCSLKVQSTLSFGLLQKVLSVADLYERR